MNSPHTSRHRTSPFTLALLTLTAYVTVLSSCGGEGSPLRPIEDLWASATSTPTLTATPTSTPTHTPTPTRKPTRTPYPRIEVRAGQLVYVKHESMSRGRGLPDTYQYFDFKFVKAPPGSAFREYIKAVQRLAVPYMSEQEFEDNMASFWAGNRALSNGHGYEQDFAVGPVITGGAMARATGNIQYRAGRALVEVYAIDPEHLPAVPSSLSQLDWTLHFRPTIVSQFVRPDGRWRINPFPQFDGQGIAPIVGRDGRQWIDALILVPIRAPLSPFEYPELQAWPTISPH